jgi:hypothetical protein
MPAHRKREDELQRPRSRAGGNQPAVTKGVMRDVIVPREDPSWHPRAKRIFKAMRSSGQADFFQDTDWAFAMFLMDEVTTYANATRKSSQMLQTILDGLGRLMLTEVDRRKARIELQEPEPEQVGAEVVAIADYRAALNAA